MKVVIATVAAAVLLASPALPADMPVKAPARAVITVFDWSGCYIGAHGGYAWGRKRVDDANGGNAELPQFNHNVDGLLIGGQIGCNLQRDHWVLGIEGQAAWADVDGGVPFDPTVTSTVATGFHTEINLLGSIAARLGYTVGSTGQTLVYVKGGAAFAREKYALTGAGPFNNFPTDWHLRWGWMIGAGVEHGLSANWSVKAEYNFNQFGRKSYDDFCNSVGCANLGIDQQIHLVKVGINYRFGVAPVVARY